MDKKECSNANCACEGNCSCGDNCKCCKPKDKTESTGGCDNSYCKVDSTLCTFISWKITDHISHFFISCLVYLMWLWKGLCLQQTWYWGLRFVVYVWMSWNLRINHQASLQYYICQDWYCWKHVESLIYIYAWEVYL